MRLHLHPRRFLERAHICDSDKDALYTVTLRVGDIAPGFLTRAAAKVFGSIICAGVLLDLICSEYWRLNASSSMPLSLTHLNVFRGWLRWRHSIFRVELWVALNASRVVEAVSLAVGGGTAKCVGILLARSAGIAATALGAGARRARTYRIMTVIAPHAIVDGLNILAEGQPASSEPRIDRPSNQILVACVRCGSLKPDIAQSVGAEAHVNSLSGSKKCAC